MVHHGVLQRPGCYPRVLAALPGDGECRRYVSFFSPFFGRRRVMSYMLKDRRVPRVGGGGGGLSVKQYPLWD